MFPGSRLRTLARRHPSRLSPTARPSRLVLRRLTALGAASTWLPSLSSTPPRWCVRPSIVGRHRHLADKLVLANRSLSHTSRRGDVRACSLSYSPFSLSAPPLTQLHSLPHFGRGAAPARDVRLPYWPAAPRARRSAPRATSRGTALALERAATAFASPRPPPGRAPPPPTRAGRGARARPRRRRCPSAPAPRAFATEPFTADHGGGAARGAGAAAAAARTVVPSALARRWRQALAGVDAARLLLLRRLHYLHGAGGLAVVARMAFCTITAARSSTASSSITSAVDRVGGTSSASSAGGTRYATM